MISLSFAFDLFSLDSGEIITADCLITNLYCEIFLEMNTVERSLGFVKR